MAAIGVGTIEQRDLSDRLHGFRSGALDDSREKAAALRAVVCHELDLYQLMIVEGDFDLPQYSLREARVAGAHERMELVPETAKVALLCFGERGHDGPDGR